MTLKRGIKKIFFVGVGGIGISALARLMLYQKKEVSGSDIEESEITKELRKEGLKFFVGHRAENIDKDTDLLVYSAAVPENNPERAKAEGLGIKELSYPEFLGELSRKKRTVAVAGTHGKSTTTALGGLLLEAGGFDPTIVVGSRVKTFTHKNLRIGRGDYFVAEACEYRGHLLHLDPWIIILTNIEKDHLDYYADESNIIDTFQAFIDKLPPEGILIMNTDDPNSEKLKIKHKNIITFGIENRAEVLAKNIYIKNKRQYLDLYYKYGKLGQIELQIPGKFNIYNTLAAIALALHLEIDFKVIRETLAKFGGLWRRFEKVGERDGAIIISDYGHHPTAIRETLKAAREFYPARRIILAFEPHQHNRTKNLFNDFVKSFDGADFLILSEIYEVAGREQAADQDVNSRVLAERVEQRFKENFLDKTVIYSPDLKNTKKIILENLEPNDLVIIMGAGDIYRVARKIIEK